MLRQLPGDLRASSFNIFPGQTKRAHVDYTQRRNRIGNRVRRVLVEFAVHHRAFGPIHKIRDRDVVLQIRSDRLGYLLLLAIVLELSNPLWTRSILL